MLLGNGFDGSHRHVQTFGKGISLARIKVLRVRVTAIKKALVDDYGFNSQKQDTIENAFWWGGGGIDY